MAYGYRKKKMMFRRRRRFRKKAPSAWSSAKNLAWKGYKLARWVKSMVNVENKFIDVHNTVAFSTTPVITPLTLVAEGDDYNQRNGRSIKLSSVNCKYYINSSATATAGFLTRVIIFSDMDSRGSVPTASELFQDSTAFNSPVNLNNGKRFAILYDKIQLVSVSGETNSLLTKKYFKKMSHHITYMGTGATQADADTGHLYICYFSTGGANPPGFDYYFRTRFIDN